jgi:hypothetical protein
MEGRKGKGKGRRRRRVGRRVFVQRGLPDHGERRMRE